MTTSTFEVGDLFSVLGARGIEKQLQRVPGVGRVSVNPVSGSTTVAYDPAETSVSAIQAAIDACGFHCAGEALPKHVCANPAMPDGVRAAAQAKPAQPNVNMDHAAMSASDTKAAGAPTEVKPQGAENAPADRRANGGDESDAGYDAHGGEKSDAMAHEMATAPAKICRLWFAICATGS
jgi:Cu2+-exporting ATPase